MSWSQRQCIKLRDEKENCRLQRNTKTAAARPVFALDEDLSSAISGVPSSSLTGAKTPV